MLFRSDAIIAPVIARRPAIWWLRAFGRHGVACGLAHHFETYRFHQQIVDNEMIAPLDTEWGEVVVGGLPWHFSGTPCTVLPPPKPGQHTVEILGSAAAEGAGHGV